MAAFAKQPGIELRIVAPVPYYPPVKVGARSKYRQVVEKELCEGIEVTHPRYLLTPKIGMSLYGISLCLSVLSHVKHIQRTFDFDVIDSHFVYPDGFAAVLLGAILGRPVTISARGSDVNVYKNMFLIPRLLRYALEKADRVIAVSQALATAISDLGIRSGKIAVIPNGVDCGKFYPEDPAEMKKRLGYGGEHLVLSVGHLTVNKGFDILLRALKIIRDRKEELCPHLAIIGDGPIRGDLEVLARALGLEHLVRFVGAVPHGELRAWYNAADLFCLASEREGWPNVVGEALACGTPVVATRAGGIPEIVNASSLGILTDRTPLAFAESIAEALARQWDRETIVEAARRRSWDHAAKDLRTVFDSVREEHNHLNSVRYASAAGT
ncbi:MAG: glycosyltransferase, partial [Nitrospira sp.]